MMIIILFPVIKNYILFFYWLLYTFVVIITVIYCSVILSVQNLLIPAPMDVCVFFFTTCAT